MFDRLLPCLPGEPPAGFWGDGDGDGKAGNAPSCAALAERCTLRAYIQNLLGGREGEERGREGGEVWGLFSLRLWGGVVVSVLMMGQSRNGLGVVVGPMMGRGLAFAFLGASSIISAAATVVVVLGFDTRAANGFLVAGCRINDFAAGGVFMLE